MRRIAIENKYLRWFFAIKTAKQLKKKKNIKNSLNIKGREIAEYLKEDEISTI